MEGGGLPVIEGTTQQVFTVTAESQDDLLARLVSFVPSGLERWAVISASGTLSRVTVNQRNTQYQPILTTFQDRFQIVSLTGLITTSVDELGVTEPQTHAVVISAVGPYGHVISGVLGSPTTAYGPVHMVFASPGIPPSPSVTPMSSYPSSVNSPDPSMLN